MNDAQRDTPSRKPLVAACVVLAGVVAGYAVGIAGPVIRTTHLVDDYRQAAIWLVDARAHVAIDGDPIAEYSRGFMPPVLAETYGALARVVDPYALTKWLSLGLVAAFVCVAAGVGQALAGGAGAAALAALVIADLDWNRAIFGALSRSYAPLLQAGLVWALLTRRRFAVAAWLGAAALLHPQSLLLGIVVVAITVAIDVRRGRERTLPPPADSPKAWLAVSLAVAAGLAINATHFRGMEQRFGSMYGRAEFLATPEMNAGGRWANERPDALVVEAARALGGHLGALGVPFESQRFDSAAKRYGWAVALLAIVAAILDGLRRAARKSWSEVPSVWLAMPVSGVALAAAAELLLPRLYFPRRFVEVGLPFAMQMAIAMWLVAWMERVSRSTPLFAVPTGVLALFALSGLVTLPGGRFPGYWVHSDPYQGVARFLASQPPKTVYAARPLEDADTLAALVPRHVFVAREIGHPLFRGYLENVIRPRTLAAWRAIFPLDPDADLRALRESGADFLVLRRSDLTDSSPLAREIDEPYRDVIVPGWNADQAARRTIFWRRHGDAFVYRDRAYAVADLRRLDPGAQRSAEITGRD